MRKYVQELNDKDEVITQKLKTLGKMSIFA